MKVVLVCYEFPKRPDSAVVSGEIKHPWNLARWLTDAGHEVEVLSCSAEEATFVDRVSGVRVTAIDVHRGRGVFRHYRRAVRIYSALRKLLMDSSVDVIHTHVAYGALAARLAARRSCRVVSTAHGTNIPEIATELARGTRLRMLRWVNAIGQAVLDAVGWRLADVVISVSRYQVSELTRIYRIPNRRIRVVSTGVDSRYAFDAQARQAVRGELGIASDDRVVLLCGRLAKKKRFGWALRALARHGRPVPQHVLCVTGSDEFVTDATDFLTAVGDTSGPLAVHRLHAVPEADLPAVFSAADVLVCPSSGYESLPNVLLEGLRNGLEVVATDAWGHRELSPAVSLFAEGDSVGMLSATLGALEKGAGARLSRAPEWADASTVTASLESLYRISA